MNAQATTQHEPGTIAALINGNEGYGNAQAILSLFGELRRLGWNTVIISLGDGNLAQRCRDEGFSVTALNLGIAPVLHGNPLRRAMQFSRMVRFQRAARHAVADAVRQLRPDVLHVLKSNLLDLAGCIARRAGIVAVWEMPRFIEARYPFQLNRRYYQRICRRHGIIVTANSDYTASTMRSPNLQPVVTHLGIDADRFDPQHVKPVARAELGIPDEAIVFGIAGSLSEMKGQDRFLLALASHRNHQPPLHLLLLGEPTSDAFANTLDAIAEEHDLSDRLHMIGRVDHPQRYYPAMDVAVSSYIGAEGFGLSVVEAMMMGRPALVHALGGPAETVLDGITGWHVPHPTVDAFAAGIRRALTDRSRWADLGAAARRHALEHFTIERQAQRYLDVVAPRIRR